MNMTRINNALKVLLAVAALATAVASPALAQRSEQSGQNYGGTYRGYPLSDWNTHDSW
jgi:hypothetical protein